MIPNFVQQISAVEQDMMTIAIAASDDWNDDNKEQFYNLYVKVYDTDLEIFIKGGTRNYGMGLDELLAFCDRKEREMEALGRF